jgi:beta-lactamase regulating signal transducer with metallopeptidase domain
LLSFSLSLFLTGSVTTSKNVIRLTSTTTTVGTFNIFISFLEDLFVIIKTMLSGLFVLFSVIFAFVFIVLCSFLFYKVLNKILKMRNLKGIDKKGII